MVGLVAAAEIGFWVVLAAGLAVRYPLRMPRLSAGVLLCVPLIDVLLLTATVLDLRDGAEASGAHGLAALYLGFTVAYGHYTIRWLDGHAAHRLGGAPRPAEPPRHGMARARHEWRLWGMTLIAVLIGLAVLQGMIWWIDDPDRTQALGSWRSGALRVLVIHGIIALSYTLWPKKDRGRAPSREAPARPVEREGQ
jgi:cytochrome bd-type quinol oxidase subunit 2